MTRKELSTKSPLRVLLACFCFVVSAHSASAQVVAVDDTVHVGVNDAITIDALWNDSTQSGTLRIVGVDDLGASGTVTLKEDSTGILYSPSEDFSGTESFAYTATDGSSEASATVVVIVDKGLSVDFDTIALYKNDDADTLFMRDSGLRHIRGNPFGSTAENGLLGGERCFDGVDDKVDLEGLRPHVNGLEALTIEFVAKKTNGWPAFVNHSNTGGWVLIPSNASVTYGLKLTVTGGLWAGNSWLSVAHDGVADSLHQYVAMTWESGDSIRVYVNGENIGGYRTIGGQFVPQPNFGIFLGHSDFGDFYYSGCIDELRLSSTRHTDSLINATWQMIRDDLGQPSLVGVDEQTTPGVPDGIGLSIAAYPNPFEDRLTIDLESSAVRAAADIEVELFDLLGRRVREARFAAGAAQVELSTDGLPSGTYFVRVRDGGSALRSMTRVVTRR